MLGHQKLVAQLVTNGKQRSENSIRPRRNHASSVHPLSTAVRQDQAPLSGFRTILCVRSVSPFDWLESRAFNSKTGSSS